MKTIRVHFLPQSIEPRELSGCVAVVIDVLRSTTTMIHALAAGARDILPCAEVDEARRAVAALPAGTALLGGERSGQRIEGFALVNSPEEYTPERVAGRSIVFTSTNGTHALARCREASEIWIGGFVNLSALCRRAARCERVDLVCAGTDGQTSRDDVLAAGAIVEKLTSAGFDLDDSALVARDAWQALELDYNRLLAALRESLGGRNLIALGLDRDIEAAAAIDRFAIVPHLEKSTGRIVVAEENSQ